MYIPDYPTMVQVTSDRKEFLFLGVKKLLVQKILKNNRIAYIQFR